MLSAFFGSSMSAAGESAAAGLLHEVTVGIKHTSSFVQRRLLLGQLLRSIRRLHGSALRILVADDGSEADHEVLRANAADHIALPANAGLSYGRNALVQATTTAFIAILNDDVLLDSAASLEALFTTLQQSPGTAVAGGCYRDVRTHDRDCLNLRFDVEESGANVRARSVHLAGGCARVHATHDFFVARTDTLRRFGWDSRQKMVGRETFFYQLFLNEQAVVACPNVEVLHNTTRDDEYRERSLVQKEARYTQFLCKNFPELTRFHTPYMEWRCDTRTYCTPDWQVQFAFDAFKCNAMHWSTSDRSVASLPLVSGPIHPAHRFPLRSNTLLSRHVPLLVLILTERRNTERREWQRATWLSFAWHSSHMSSELTPWRYLYFLGRRRHDREDTLLDSIAGDTVTLSAVREGYDTLIFKTMEALRWTLKHTSFDLVLKTDDDSMVHIGRLWQWLVTDPPPKVRRTSRGRVYAGHVVKTAQVIRANFSRRDLWHPDWFPADFSKWAVDPADYAPTRYPPYCSGGGYVLGNDTAALILAQYDRRRDRIIPVEDAFLGVLANASGVAPLDLRSFREPPRGSRQGPKLFVDQILVHRVAEPLKAFRWLMLSESCYDSVAACAIQLKRTRGLPYQDAENDARLQRLRHSRPPRRYDWANGEIPSAGPDAVTGSSLKSKKPRLRHARSVRRGREFQ